MIAAPPFLGRRHQHHILQMRTQRLKEVIFSSLGVEELSLPKLEGYTYLAQGALDDALSSMGALHALRPRLDRFHQLLLEPPKVGDMGCASSGKWGWKRKYPVSTKPSLFL